MRNILLCVVGAIAITGCAAHESSWRVRDQHGWPVQTWDSVPLVVMTNANRCRNVGLKPTPRLVPAGNAQPYSYCCEIEVSTNSYGDYAARCGGQPEVAMIPRAAPPSPPPPPPSMPRPVRDVTPVQASFRR
jgi:hypothetical protein